MSHAYQQRKGQRKIAILLWPPVHVGHRRKDTWEAHLDEADDSGIGHWWFFTKAVKFVGFSKVKSMIDMILEVSEVGRRAEDHSHFSHWVLLLVTCDLVRNAFNSTSWCDKLEAFAQLFYVLLVDAEWLPKGSCRTIHN